MPLARKEERVLNEVGSLEPQNPPCSHWSEARSQCHSFSLSFSLLYVSINLSTPCFSSSHGFSHLPQPNYKYPYSGNISPTDFFFFPIALWHPSALLCIYHSCTTISTTASSSSHQSYTHHPFRFTYFSPLQFFSLSTPMAHLFIDTSTCKRYVLLCPSVFFVNPSSYRLSIRSSYHSLFLYHFIETLQHNEIFFPLLITPAVFSRGSSV